jgi:NAD-dependent SIR2 family protein deacetylase
MSIGTSSVVNPAAGLIDVAIQRAIPSLEIDPTATPFSDRFEWSIRRASGDVLPWLLDGISNS